MHASPPSMATDCNLRALLILPFKQNFFYMTKYKWTWQDSSRSHLKTLGIKIFFQARLLQHCYYCILESLFSTCCLQFSNGETPLAASEAGRVQWGGLHWGWKSAANIPISVRTTTMAQTFRANIWYREDIYDVSRTSWNGRVSQKHVIFEFLIRKSMIILRVNNAVALS